MSTEALYRMCLGGVCFLACVVLLLLAWLWLGPRIAAAFEVARTTARVTRKLPKKGGRHDRDV